MECFILAGDLVLFVHVVSKLVTSRSSCSQEYKLDSGSLAVWNMAAYCIAAVMLM